LELPLITIETPDSGSPVSLFIVPLIVTAFTGACAYITAGNRIEQQNIQMAMNAFLLLCCEFKVSVIQQNLTIEEIGTIVTVYTGRQGCGWQEAPSHEVCYCSFLQSFWLKGIIAISLNMIRPVVRT
jgi:hypothetical protein